MDFSKFRKNHSYCFLFAFYIYRFIGFFPLGSFYVFLPQYLITNGLAELDASVAISLMGLAGAVGWGLIGIVTDRSKTNSFRRKFQTYSLVPDQKACSI